MRRLASLLWITFALLLLLVGLAGAVLTGPDDTVEMVSQEMGEAGGIPLVTSPALTDVTGLDLVVSAESTGQVFVGAAHRVDVEDLVDEAEHHRVTGLRPSFAGGAHSTVREGSTFLRSTDQTVDELDVWLEQASGAGPREITLPLTGEPVGVLVVAADAAPVVSFSYRWSGVFFSALRVALIGLLGLVLWVLHRRRRRRQGLPAGAAARPDAASTTRVPSQRSPHQVGRPVGRIALLVVGTVAVAGCVPAASVVETPRKLALESGELPEVVADLAERRGAAAKAARAPRSDFSRWSDAMNGPFADTALFATRHDERTGMKAPAPAPLEAGERVWAPVFESYPMWAFADVPGIDAPLTASGEKSQRTQRRTDAKKLKAGRKGVKPSTNLVLLTREAASQPWRAFTGVRVETDALPDPASELRGPDLGSAVTKRAEQAVAQFQKWWRTGKKRGLTVNPATRRLRPVVTKFMLNGETRPTRLDFSAWPKPEEGLRIVETRDGYLVMSTFRLRMTLHAPGQDLEWSDPINRELLGSSSRGPHRQLAVSSAIHLPEDGPAEILASDLMTLLG